MNPWTEKFKGLSPRLAVVVWLVAQGYNNSEISRQLDLPITTVHNRIQEAMETLKIHKLERYSPRVRLAVLWLMAMRPEQEEWPALFPGI